MMKGGRLSSLGKCRLGRAGHRSEDEKSSVLKEIASWSQKVHLSEER